MERKGYLFAGEWWTTRSGTHSDRLAEVAARSQERTRFLLSEALSFHVSGGLGGGMDKIKTTIKREWLKQIANRTKRIEYREIKPYWENHLSQVKPPFMLRLINGMQRLRSQ